MTKTLIYILLTIIFYAFVHKLSIPYLFSDLKDYLSVLIDVSAMVFTIMGIWIAFLYPNALSRIVNPNVETADFSETLLETKRLEALVACVLKSALVTLFVLFIFLLKILLHETNLYQSNITFIKEIVLTLIILLSYVQVEAVAYVVFSNIMFLNDLHNKREERQADLDV